MKTASVPFLLLVGSLTLIGQDVTPRLKFEVASVKRLQELQPEMMAGMRLRGDTLRFGQSRLKDLIQWAYDLKQYQLTGGPGWLESEFYAIEAKAKGSASRDEFRLMMRELLAERLKLVLHHEARELPGYVLSVGKNGPKLRIVESTDTPQAQISMFRDGQKLLSRLTAKQALMPMVCDVLTAVLGGRPIVDRTGLTGRYDFTLDWDPNEADSSRETSALQFPAPSLPAALNEQLGLTLEAQKVPADVIVIDSVEKDPTAN